MKLVVGIILCLVSLGAYSKEVIVVEGKDKNLYALLTDCRPSSKEAQVKVSSAKVGERITVKTRRNRTQRCEITKVIKLT